MYVYSVLVNVGFSVVAIAAPVWSLCINCCSCDYDISALSHHQM